MRHSPFLPPTRPLSGGRSQPMSPTRIAHLLIPCLIGVCLAGCDSPTDRFRPNAVYARVASHRVAADPQTPLADIDAVLTAWFGTPDAPRLPEDFPTGLIDPEGLARAAGPVSSDKGGVNFGIYRANCVVCHGLEGGGNGPAAALQNPYPRDFRPGIFKYKSTSRDSKPTREDLRNVLRQGLPGTGMPSFARLAERDLEAVVDYVIYLSIRGEAERRLLVMAFEELGYGESEIPVAAEERLMILESGRLADDDLAEQIEAMIQDVAANWLAAESLAVPEPPAAFLADRAAAAERGRELFHGPLANCASCHGKEGSGDAVTLDFDEWTKEYTTRLGIGPESSDFRSWRRAGALQPRPISPRKLAWGNFRGGADDRTLYRLLVSGIAGTPMPGLLVVAPPQSDDVVVGITPDQVWDLVAYLQTYLPPGSLP